MTIGCYETVRLLGKGGMSEVYEAVNPRLGSHHALKLFVYEKDDPEVRRRFEDEGRLLARGGPSVGRGREHAEAQEQECEQGRNRKPRERAKPRAERARKDDGAENEHGPASDRRPVDGVRFPRRRERRRGACHAQCCREMFHLPTQILYHFAHAMWQGRPGLELRNDLYVILAHDLFRRRLRMVCVRHLPRPSRCTSST